MKKAHPLKRDFIAARNSILNDVFSEQPPETLRHYTDLEGLAAIVRGQSLLFSNPLTMNDRDEVTGFLNRAKELLSTDSELEAFIGYKVFDEFREKYLSKYDAYLRAQMLDIYIFCFSEDSTEDGLLSMWRGYGKNGAGVAVGFQVLENTSRYCPFEIRKVKYLDAEGQTLLIKKIISEHVRIYHSHKNQEVRFLSGAIFDSLADVALFVKHFGFKEENEWRVKFSKLPHLTDQNLMYFPIISSNSINVRLLVPINFPNGVGIGEDWKILRLSSVLIGPTIASELSQRAIDKLVTSATSSDSKVHITSSEIPYRPKT